MSSLQTSQSTCPATKCGSPGYRRSGNFRVKYTSPFNFSRCFIFVARAHRRKLNHAKILFTRTRARSQSRDRIPCRAIGEKLEPRISASEGMQQTPMPYYWYIERELPSATYLERFHPSVSVRGSNCLQKFASAIARLGWYRRAQRSSRIRNTIDRFLVAQQNHACTSIHENSHVK